MKTKIKNISSGNSSLAQIPLQELHEHILKSVHDGIHVVDINGVVLVENEASAKMLGWCNDCLVGKHGHEAIHHHHADNSAYEIEDCPIYQTIQDGQTREIKEDVFWRQDGSSFPVEFSTAPLKNSEGAIYGATVIFRDITERKEANARILRLALTCSLTDLPNRNLLDDRLVQAIALAKRRAGQFALIYLDLDKFKPVNDEYGHDIGDALLREAARRMTQSIRNSDTVARVGGDEFIALLPSIETENDALIVAEKLRSALSEVFLIEKFCLYISASIGVSIYPEHGTSKVELSKHADQAMYLAKQNGRNQVRLFEPAHTNTTNSPGVT